MANPKIKVKRSSVEGKVPAVSQLERGELAVNSYDGKIYILKDQFSVGIATTTHTVNPWNEPNGVGAGISYSGDTLVVGIATFFKTVRAHNGIIIGDDNKSILLGTSDDMRIRHTGSHSEITDEGTGDLRLGSSRTVIGNPTFSETCARFVQNGPSELYHDNTLRLKTSSSGVNITDDFGVSGLSTLGSGGSGQAILQYQGSTKLSTQNWGVQATGTIQSIGNLEAVNTSSQTDGKNIHIRNLQSGGGVKNVLTLSHESNNSSITGHVGNISINAPTVSISTNFTVAGESTFTGGVKLDASNADFDDDVKIRMGDSQDLLIFHQESNGNSIIREQGGGVLSLQTNGDYMNIWDSTNQQTMAQFNNGGSCQFRNNGTIRLKTTSTGAEVIGTLETDALTLGNFNMPTTIGAQDTVLKSDGTNVVFGSAASATFTEKAFTATQGQTVFTDTTNLPTYIQVFVNGVKIRPTSDFSKSGASVTLVNAATAGDEIDIVRFD